jgi:hypothetical protein
VELLIMSVVVTLKIPEEVAHQAQAVATSTKRRVEDVLTEWLDRAAAEIPVEQLPDNEVRTLVKMQMSEDQQSELNELLDSQREAQLTNVQQTRLDVLMQIYRRGLVRKAQAVKVAVDRGLMPPLG